MVTVINVVISAEEMRFWRLVALGALMFFALMVGVVVRGLWCLALGML